LNEKTTTTTKNLEYSTLKKEEKINNKKRKPFF